MNEPIANNAALSEELQFHWYHVGRSSGLKAAAKRLMEDARGSFALSNDDEAKLLQTLASIFSENEKNEGVKNGK